MAFLINTSAAKVAHSLTRIAKRRVVYVGSVGDAASPVWLVAGEYSKQIGQCADWRHNVELAAERHDALYVEGSYDGGRWVVGLGDEFATAVARDLGVITVAEEEAREARRHADMVAEMNRLEAERPAREAAEARYKAVCDARAEELRPLYEAARARVRTNRHGQPRQDDVHLLEWAFAVATGRTGGGYDHDMLPALTRLRRLAARGFANPVTA